MNQRLNDVMVLGGLVLFGVFLAKKYAPAIGTAINPLNPGNAANTAFNAVYQGVTGSEQTFGADVYDATHFDPFQDQGQSVYQVPPMY